jgi:ParB family chromosome partitioning protein
MTPRKSGLGKGLEALIPIAEEETAAAAAQGITEVPLASITPNPHQPRTPIRDQDLVELAASIEEHGIIQPLVVTTAPDGYQLIAGERRWRAARLARLSTVPVIVKEVAPSGVLELALVENIQRADLNALEEAMAYRQLTEEFGLTQQQVAKRVGRSRAAITNTLRLLKAARAVQEALLEDKISEGHARALLGLEKATDQGDMLKEVLAQGLNVRQTEELVRRKLDQRKRKQRPAREVSPEEEKLEAQRRKLEEDFRQALDMMHVNLKLSGKGDHIERGRLVIHFYSEEDLNAFYERIVGSE